MEYQSRPCLGSLALTRSLRTTSLHLLVREAAQITSRRRITALSMPLLSSESELLVPLLALGAGLVGVGTGTLATTVLVGVVNGDVEEVVGVLGRAGGISLALCDRISIALISVSESKKENSLFLRAVIFSKVSLFSFCLCCNLANCTCLPNFFRSRCLRASAAAFLLAASSYNFFLILPICSSDLTISAK